MPMTYYIETELVLDSLDILNLISLASDRLKELKEWREKEFKKAPNSISVMLADEQIYNWAATLRKLKAANRAISDKRKANGR